MQRLFQFIAIILLVSDISAENVSRVMGENSPASIGVKVYNYAEAPKRVLAEAQRKASDVLRETGIESEWFACPVSLDTPEAGDACNAAIGPRNLVLKLVPNDVARQFYPSRHSLGFALLSNRGGPTSDAWVFYGRVLQQAQEGGSHTPVVLGYAMAHEIGHLLLGQGGHASKGIMKGIWNKKELREAERGTLGFSPGQAARMRAQIDLRMEIGLSASR